METAMKKLMLAAAGALALLSLPAGSASAGWDDSYAYCCDAYWYRWVYYGSPGYFARHGYGYRRGYRASHRLGYRHPRMRVHRERR